MLRAASTAPVYYFNFKKFYKIWFSSSADIFLGLENELRLINLRQKHPQAVIHLVYSSVALSAEALVKLQNFCATHKIIPLDFDTQLLDLLQTDKEKQVYSFAKEEIQHTLNADGGNLASASDCVRVLPSVIEALGNYSDCDMSFNLGRFANALVALNSPVILNHEEVYYLDGKLISCNSDFLAFSVEKENENKLTHEAREALENLQDVIIANYSRPIPVSIIYPCNQTSGLPRLLQLVNKSYEPIFAAITQGKALDIFSYRKACLAYFTQHSVMPDMQEFIFNNTVLAMAGPSIYGNLYKHHLQSPLQPVTYFNPADATWSDYRRRFRLSAVSSYPLIADAIELTNQSSNETSLDMRSSISDKAWTLLGAENKRHREDAALCAGKRIYGLWRKPATAHNILLNRAKMFCTPSLYNLLKSGDYSLVLRKACAVANLPLVLLLLDFRRRLNIDLNETSKNGNTALDWANEAVDNPKQAEVCNALINAGAKTGVSFNSN